jgi:predicted dehydrogenase
MNNKQVTFAVIGAGNRGIEAYGRFIEEHPHLARVTAVAEPLEGRRKNAARLHDIPAGNVFKDWRQLAEKPKIADAVFITTSDSDHREPAIAFANKGYHILLEKPMAPRLKDCYEIAKAAEDNKIRLVIGHVLRYAPYYMKVKEIIEEGVLGDICSINHTEGVGWLHQAHSYVRGNWNNTEKSSFMLLAKSCHDIDLITWWLGRQCRKVSSFGSLKHFNAANKPDLAAQYCMDCPLQDEGCLYSAKKFYFGHLQNGNHDWPVSVLLDEFTPEALEEKLRTSDYGRCVYASDNDVVDHQVVAMDYDEDITVTFTMTAFAPEGRRTVIHGTKGCLEGDGKTIRILDYETNSWTRIPINKLDDNLLEGHGGGDYGIMMSFLKSLANDDPSEIKTGCFETLQSHLITFAAEQSRLEGRTIDIESFYKELESVYAANSQ